MIRPEGALAIVVLLLCGCASAPNPPAEDAPEANETADRPIEWVSDRSSSALVYSEVAGSGVWSGTVTTINVHDLRAPSRITWYVNETAPVAGEIVFHILKDETEFAVKQGSLPLVAIAEITESGGYSFDLDYPLGTGARNLEITIVTELAY